MAKALKEKASTEVSTEVLSLFEDDAGSCSVTYTHPDAADE